jgi:hypothetical protein
MSIAFGKDVVTFLSENQTGARGSLGTKEMAETRTDVKGCHHRPFRASGRGSGPVRAEYPEVGTGVATEWWQSTCPPDPAALAAKANDFIEVNGERYKIVGESRPFNDGTKPFKVTILSERQTIA